MNQSIDITNMPKHIGMIMDGNGRWAQRAQYDPDIGTSLCDEGGEDCYFLLFADWNQSAHYVRIFNRELETPG